MARLMSVSLVLGKDKDGLWVESFSLGNGFNGSKVDCKDGTIYTVEDNTWNKLSDVRRFDYWLDESHYNDGCKYGWGKKSVESVFKSLVK